MLVSVLKALREIQYKVYKLSNVNIHKGKEIPVVIDHITTELIAKLYSIIRYIKISLISCITNRTIKSSSVVLKLS